MGENNERNIYRIVVFIVLIVGALVFMWLLSQGDQSLGDQGIFQFFTDPGKTPPSDE